MQIMSVAAWCWLLSSADLTFFRTFDDQCTAHSFQICQCKALRPLGYWAVFGIQMKEDVSLLLHRQRKICASGLHLKRCIKERAGPSPPQGLQTWDPPPPEQGQVFGLTSHFNH
eukprot:1140429-Pelagomonas_calceolata.AAC.7